MDDWRECRPQQVDMESSGLDRATALVQAQRAAAQLCVLRHGRVVLDRALGCRPDSLFLIYSASKLFIALAVHLLAERGAIDLDAPVATYWPGYAQHGKAPITIRHVLQHRAGVPVAGGVLRTMRSMSDWNQSVRDAEAARPRWPGGQVAAYHFITYGFILGELVQRVSRTPVRQFLTEQMLAPVGLHDTYLGLPDVAWPRHVPVRAAHPSELVNSIVFNRRDIRQAVIPAAGMSTTARQLARFYQMLLLGGQLDGTRVLNPDTIAEARRPSNDGEIDAFIKRPVRWAQGFQLGGPGPDPRDMTRIMGANSSAETFGHAGNASCIAWADPSRDLVVVYLSSKQLGISAGVRHHGEVSDAILASCH